MKMKVKTKSLFKKIALALAGVVALTAVAFGVKAIVDYTKNDLKKITPTFEVGNLGADGKYVDDDSTLYTKQAFACYGLQIKPDFDSTVNYQIYYYDILDNYISSTEVLSEGYSSEAPLNGAYARMVINPVDDEDGKISLTERISYPRQLTIKVKKEQDINNRFVVYKGRVLAVETLVDDLVFVNGLSFVENPLRWEENEKDCCTATTVLKVDGGSTISFNFEDLGLSKNPICNIFTFSNLPSDEAYLGIVQVHDKGNEVTLGKKVNYVIISFNGFAMDSALSESQISKLPSLFSVTKSK